MENPPWSADRIMRGLVCPLLFHRLLPVAFPDQCLAGLSHGRSRRHSRSGGPGQKPFPPGHHRLALLFRNLPVLVRSNLATLEVGNLAEKELGSSEDWGRTFSRA